MLRLPALTAFSLATALLAATALTACSGIKTEAPEVNPTDMPKGPGLLSGESGNLLDAFKRNPDGSMGSGGAIGVKSLQEWHEQ